METRIIQLTSGRGPAECCMAVALALKEIIKEAKDLQLSYEVIDRVPGSEKGTLVSAVIKITGNKVSGFVQTWEGVMLWIAQSPYRKLNKRKNWFIGIQVYNISSLPVWKENEVRYQTMRASGPGGQNVNKVESAVRATHMTSGLQVMVNESRSQLQNKKMATERLKEEFMKWQLSDLKNTQNAQWQNHNSLERGNPKRTYAGMDFKKQ